MGASRFSKIKKPGRCGRAFLFRIFEKSSRDARLRQRRSDRVESRHGLAGGGDQVEFVGNASRSIAARPRSGPCVLGMIGPDEAARDRVQIANPRRKRWLSSMASKRPRLCFVKSERID
jgi:hypothetical protein